MEPENHMGYSLPIKDDAKSLEMALRYTPVTYNTGSVNQNPLIPFAKTMFDKNITSDFVTMELP